MQRRKSVAFDKAKFLTRFIDEAKEHVSRLNEGLQILEKNPDDAETLNGVFRSAHTIKGSARMMKLIPVSLLAHKTEDVLDAFRQKKIMPSKALSDLLFQGTDAIDSMLDRIAEGEEVNEVPETLCLALERAVLGEITGQGSGDRDQGTGEPLTPGTQMSGDRKLPDIGQDAADAAKAEGGDTTEKKKDSAPVTPAKPQDAEPSSAQSAPHTEALPVEASDRKTEKKKSETAGSPQHITSETIRIDADKLDELIKLMGEIVSGHSRTKRRVLDIREIEKISKKHLEFITSLPGDCPLSSKQLTQLLSSAEKLGAGIKKLSTLFKEDINVQGILTGNLQDRSLKMRMVPLSTIFRSFSRSVRQLSRSFGKQIDFAAEGGETELDKKIVEKIGDPLLHMIRNCIDHGIEPPQARKKAGKSETGLIRLTAGYEGENVVIRLSDDGAGIPVDRIREKALKKKMFTAAEMESIPESEIINLIFLPGFSSSEIVTDISGRGVGMDVVKKNVIGDLKGSVQIETAQGKGTVFHIRLPLTMAVIHVLLIRVARMVFAVPANYIDEIVRMHGEKVIQVMERRAVRLREQIIPIVPLMDVLSLPGERPVQPDAEYLILIASVGTEKLGVIIDALLDEEDMVIKPLPAHMRNVPFVSGCIISGGNEIFSVLHMPRIIESAREIRVRERSEKQSPEKQRHILIVEDSLSTREIEKSILESYGYTVSLAGDGIEGYEKARKNRYDLIITDVEMPRLDGFSLTQKLREEEDCRDIPIILVTSLDKEEDKKKGILAGADAYIVKGDFEQSALLDTVRNLLG